LSRLKREDVINGEIVYRAAALAPRVLTPYLSAQAPPCRVSVGLWAAFPLALRGDLRSAGAASVAYPLKHAAC